MKRTKEEARKLAVKHLTRAIAAMPQAEGPAPDCSYRLMLIALRESYMLEGYPGTTGKALRDLGRMVNVMLGQIPEGGA